MERERDITEIVRGAFLAINSGDEEAFLDTLHDDVEWRSRTVGIVPAEVLVGREAVRRGRAATEGEGRHVHTTLQEIHRAGDAVLVFGVVTAETAHRGRMMLPMAWIWRMRGNRAADVESFPSRQAALVAWKAIAG